MIIENVQLAVKAGETLAIIGRNGVGKTTLLSTIMGHTTLHGGRIVLHGRDIARLPPYRRVAAGLGYVPQEREIFPSLTLRENLEVAVRPGRLDDRRQCSICFPRSKSGSATAAINCPAASSKCWRSPARWSAIRRCILMDEPSEGLAPVIVEELTRAVRHLADAQGLTLVLVEQNTRLALDISPRIGGDGPRPDHL